jgi:hypothetical protein
LANIGYIQVVRHCNHFCGFCSNPTTPYVHTFETMKVLVDDLVARKYFGVILTGGEPSLHPELPRIARYATDQGLHVRMITNGWRMADEGFAKEMAEAGLKIVHVSVYSTRPAVEERLRSELAGSGNFDPERIGALPYLDAVVRESLRLCPIIPLVGRVLQEDVTLGGYPLKRGMGAVCSIYLAQRRPEVYAEPERFVPERFLDKKFTPAEFFPFGGGIRRCIGMAFALFEMKMVLARLLQRTRLRLTPRGPIRPVRRSITLMPSDGLLLSVVEKKARG